MTFFTGNGALAITVKHKRRDDVSKLRVAIIHDYLNQMGGAERVVGVIRGMFPEAPIYTTIADKDKLLPELQGAEIHTTWMQRIPGIKKWFKHFFWLYPFAIRSIDLSGYDLIISSSSAYAKGVRKPEGSIHICYCHTPMRFAWDFETYMNGVRVPALFKKIAKWLTKPLRTWDKTNSEDVDCLIANATIVKSRIKQHYGLDVPILFPPVNIERFDVLDDEQGDYFLVVSRLVSYKKIDLAVQACSRLNKKLVVIGGGPDLTRLQEMAGETVTFLGRIDDREVTRYMQRCKALLFPGVEDFGITPLEVNACGRPIVAFAKGGALDTVIRGVTGTFFYEHSVESLMEALNDFDNYAWDPMQIRLHAEKFNEQVFVEKFRRLIELTLDEVGHEVEQVGAVEGRGLET